MNNFKISYRNFLKHKPYSFLNLLGLSIGLCIVFTIILFINEEVGFDKQHKNYKNTYRLIVNDTIFQRLQATTNPQLLNIIKEKIPETKNVASYRRASLEINNFVKPKGIEYYYADSTITDIFTFHFIKGNTELFKNDFRSVLISKSLAESYFKEKVVVGNVIEVFEKNKKTEYRVSGVFKDFGRKSSFNPAIIIPNYDNEYYKKIMQPDQIGQSNFKSYLTLNNNISIDDVTQKINELSSSYPELKRYEISLQPLEKIHFYSKEIFSSGPKGSLQEIKSYGIIGLLILIISVLNFLLLNTGITKQRFKELAVRKINGLSQKGMLKMFLYESLIISTTCTLLAFVGMYFIIPFFNKYTNSALEFNWIWDNYYVVYVLLVVFIISLLSGFYFYNYINKTNNITILTNKNSTKVDSFFMGDSAVIVQVIIISVMITFSLGYYKQLNFMLNSEKGFDSNNLLVLETHGKSVAALKNEIQTYPFIESVARGNLLSFLGIHTTVSQTMTTEEGSTAAFPIEVMRVGYDYIPTYKIKLLQGRNFSKEFSLDAQQRNIIINETARKILNIDNPIGEFHIAGNIIGVIEDLKFESFYNKAKPLYFQMLPEGDISKNKSLFSGNKRDQLIIRYAPGQKEDAVQMLEKLLDKHDINYFPDWKEFWKNSKKYQSYVVFNPDYYDNLMNQMYYKENKLKILVLSLTLIAVFLAIFGLIGMSLFKASRKTKEIGIRKVNGANTKEILLLLNKSFIKWSIIAFIVAIPFSYYALNRWLEGFAYKTDIGLNIYALGLIITVITVLLVVSIQSFRASRANPIKSLKTE